MSTTPTTPPVSGPPLPIGPAQFSTGDRWLLEQVYAMLRAGAGGTGGPGVYTGPPVHLMGPLVDPNAPPPPPPPPALPYKNSYEAYWGALPAEVQALRKLKTVDERKALATQLKAKYSIDEDIMIKGWDPYNTMLDRRAGGWTWWPAWGQPAPPVSPGLTFIGYPSYDSAHPPAGSIITTTDFAIGYPEYKG